MKISVTIAMTAALLVAMLAPRLWACNSGSVRDAAFQERRDLHRLCVIANKDDVEGAAIFERLSAWFGEVGVELNVKLERLAADGPDVSWEQYGMPSAPPALPVTVLVGVSQTMRRAFVIEHWDPAPEASDLAMLLTSPALEAAKKDLLDVWAVMLYSPGTGEGGRAHRAALDAIEKRWDAEHEPGLSVVAFDRTDPREGLLCAFANLRPSESDWMAVLFGRGKIMGPPLEGDEITEGNIESLLNQLVVPCTCLQESIGLGVNLPLRWEKSLDDKFAVMEQAVGGGYMEITFDDQVDAMVEEVMEEQVVAEEKSLFTATVAPVVVVAFTAILATGFVVWRGKRKRDR